MKPLKDGYSSFNYSDVIFSYFFSEDCMCSKMVRDHYLVYLFSGEYILEEGKKKTVIGAGECAFMRRDVRVNMTKQAKDGKPFMGIFMHFERNFLRELYQTFDREKLPHHADKHPQSVVKLPKRPDIEGLFLSLTPYFDSTMKPSVEVMRLKLMEGIYALLNIDERFHATLFDFTEPWKIDILDFMNENYMYDLSMEEIASFTGRSLSTFKRDFKKVSDLSPEKWLVRRRLEAAHDMLREPGRKITDVYMDVGFKNLSHFSSAFKKKYGVAPSNYQ